MSIRQFSIAFVLGFISCGALVFVFVYTQLRYQSPPQTPVIDLTATSVATQKESDTVAADVEHIAAQTPQDRISQLKQRLQSNATNAGAWLELLSLYRQQGNQEQMLDAFLNYSYYELDSSKVDNVLAEVKSEWLRQVRIKMQELQTNPEQADNELVVADLIDHVQRLQFALPDDSDLNSLLAGLYRLLGDYHQANYYAILAGETPYVELDNAQAEDESAAEAPIEAPLIIPLQRYQNHFLVDVVIAGQRALLLLDTGASLTGINQRFAQNHRRIISDSHPIVLGTAGGNVTGSLFKAKTLEIGDLLFRDHPVAVFPVSDNHNFDGVLGLDVLGRFDFYIDQQQAALHLRYRLK